MDFFILFDTLELLKNKNKYLELFKQELKLQGIVLRIKNDKFIFSSLGKEIDLTWSDENTLLNYQAEQGVLPIDYVIREPKKVVAMLCSRLKLNRIIYARKCQIVKVDKTKAEDFLKTYHIQGATQSASNLALFYKEEMLALASFSKGRKMNRLESHLRSFELIRFCTKSGLTVTGGLSKLLNAFYEEKKAGDIMTYVDRQFSLGDSFVNAGFEKHSLTAPNYFLVNRQTYVRSAAVPKDVEYDQTKFYLTCNAGNVKMIFIPKSKR